MQFCYSNIIFSHKSGLSYLKGHFYSLYTLLPYCLVKGKAEAGSSTILMKRELSIFSVTKLETQKMQATPAPNILITNLNSK